MIVGPKHKFQDRPYQTDAVQAIWDYFRTKSGNPLVAMPTGTGKSVVIARFLSSVFKAYPQQRVMLLTHVKELIQQNFEKLLMDWPFAPAGIYSAGLGKRQHHAPITFAGIASVWKKWPLFGHIDLVLIDEAHLLSPNDQTMYRQFLTGLRSINPFLKVIGFTATPWRLGHGHLTDPSEDKKGNIIPSLFTDVCYDITTLEEFNKLIEQGYLIPLVPKRTRLELSTEGLHIRGGEFIEKEMQERFDREEITEAALREAIEIAEAENLQHWLIFASGTDHSDNVGEMLNSMGIATGVVHSKREGRDETIAAFKSGELRALVNNNVLTTGFDYPNIDLIIVLRATASSVLWVQMLGRGTRPVYAGEHDLNTLEGRFAAIAESGKISCRVLDYARNTATLGPINDPKIPKRKGAGGGEAPVKICDICETYNHASVRYCGGQPFKTALGCGAEFTFEVKFKDTAASDELIRGDMPIVEIFKVDHISFDQHKKVGKPDSVKVSYYCGYKCFTEYLSFEHEGWAARKARKWWNERTSEAVPTSTEDALNRLTVVKPTTHLRVWINKQYPQIMDYCFDGNAFGTEEASTYVPDMESRGVSQKQDDNYWKSEPRDKSYYDDLDDDIPF